VAPFIGASEPPASLLPTKARACRGPFGVQRALVVSGSQGMTFSGAFPAF